MEIQVQLKRFYSDKPGERGGFIKNGQIFECENTHPNPVESYCPSYEDLEKFEDAEATWQTHPNGSKNLSREDYQAFQNWADKKHYIVGKDGVFCYYVDPETMALMVSDSESCE